MRNVTESVGFRESNYQYKLRLGTINDPNAYSIHHTIECRSFKEVVMVAELWRKDRDNPVVEVDTVYLPDKVKPMPGGFG